MTAADWAGWSDQLDPLADGWTMLTAGLPADDTPVTEDNPDGHRYITRVLDRAPDGRVIEYESHHADDCPSCEARHL